MERFLDFARNDERVKAEEVNNVHEVKPSVISAIPPNPTAKIRPSIPSMRKPSSGIVNTSRTIWTNHNRPKL
jgi:hypothetical protein